MNGRPPDAYGFLRAGGQRIGAHRFAYELLVGPIPAGLHIDHLCRNRLCVNPAHLEPVTPAENIRRGFRAKAQRERKDECPEGHRFDEENTYVSPTGFLRCVTCFRVRSRLNARRHQARRRSDYSNMEIAELRRLLDQSEDENRLLARWVSDLEYENGAVSDKALAIFTSMPMDATAPTEPPLACPPLPLSRPYSAPTHSPGDKPQGPSAGTAPCDAIPATPSSPRRKRPSAKVSGVLVLGYIRVSTAKQAEEGAGLQVQETELRRWCMEHDHDLVDVHRDEGVSGSLVDRPGLAMALADMESARAQMLVVYRLDRLARDLIVQETILERLARAGRQVRSVTEPEIDGSDPTRVLIRQVLGAISQYERALIVARMHAGRAAKAAKGGYAYGSPPFGWRAVEHELVIDDGEQATMARIDELRRHHLTLRDMGEVLVAEGHRPKRSDRWHPEVLRRMIGRLEAGLRPIG